MPAHYTLAVTSCDRHDLLKQTLETFAECADQAPRFTVIMEDGPKPAPAWLAQIKNLGVVKWITNADRFGQLYSCDKLWRNIETDWVFWCEDDWKFFESGFIKPSFEILEKNPDIFTVNLRSDWNHPLVPDPKGRAFKIAEPRWHDVWGGFMLNPGLRRRSDYDRFGSYGKHTGYGEHGLGHEVELSKIHLAAGYTIASLPIGHVHHIGGGRSRAIEPLEKKVPKILIAIPACKKFEYGRWESGSSPHYNPKHEAYGTDIHISGANPRIDAIRDTWWKDIAAFDKHVVGRIFYGEGTPPSSLLGDEVILPCPDDYANLPLKTREICRWAHREKFDFVLKCDDDTAVYVDRLVLEILEHPEMDYAGYCHGDIATGGPGYILSRAAMKAVVDHGDPYHWAEDVNTCHAVTNARLKPMMLTGHHPGFAAHWFFNHGFDPQKLNPSVVTMHAVQPEMMREWYAHKEGK